ncbi:hypothetical protein G9A89_003650 [Geosiphon pyriformis]|nr:hypothetical protein G9A89_003650 [Geosiphon pyriformis]
MIRKSILKPQLQVFNSELSIKYKNISTKLHTYDTAANLSTTNLSANSTHHLSLTAPTHLSAAASEHKAKTDTTKLEIIDDSLSTNLQSEKKIKREKERRRKKNQHLTVPLLIISTLHPNNPLIAAQNWYALIVTRNCRQWALVVMMIRSTLQQPNSTAVHVLLNTSEDQNKLRNGTINYAWLVEKLFQMKECGTTFLDEEEHTMKYAKYPHDKHELWRIAYVKTESATTSKLLEIKNNLLFLSEPEYVQTFNIFGNIEDDPEEFHEHYQHLAPTREEQKQQLEQLNTQLCQHCLIPCDFQYCNKCDFIYNPPTCMIYMIPEENKPISNWVLESESIFNPDSNSNNNDDDKNNGSSSVQNGNNFNSDSNSNSKPKQYIALPNFTKEQKT